MGEGKVSLYAIKASMPWSGDGSVELLCGGTVISTAKITESQVMQLGNRAGGSDVPRLFLWRLVIEALPDESRRDVVREAIGWDDSKQALSETIR